MYSRIKKVILHFMSAYIGSFKSYWKRSTKFNINMCPRYGVMSVHIITGICQFHNRVAKYDMWPLCKGG